VRTLTRRRFLALSAAAPALLGQSPRAREVHRHALVLDAHVHALDREFYHGGSMGTQYPDGQWDLVRAKEGGLGAFFLSVYVPEEYLPGRFETKQALRRIDHALEQLRLNHDLVELALTPDDVERIHAKGKIAAILDIEGSYDLDGDLGVLHDLHRLGLRSAQLSAHNWNEHYADSCCATPEHHGLTEHGRAVIAEMNRLGIMINVSHSGDETISQTIDASHAPVIATHHGLRSIIDIPRTMPDDLLKKLAGKGGVMGFQIGSDFNNRRAYEYNTKQRGKTFWDTTNLKDRVANKTIYEVDQLVAPGFPMVGARLPDNVAMTVDEWVTAIDKAIQLVGEDHVALGSDFDGGPPLARGMRDVRDLPLITEAMLRRGYSTGRIEKFWGGNVMRLFREVTAHSNRS
jgi:membrane dipeptidase